MPGKHSPAVVLSSVMPPLLLFLLATPASEAIEIGAEIGPYTVTRILPMPPGGIGDVEYAGEFLYSLENYDGNIHLLDPLTGEVLADYWVPGESLHDDWPYDGPRGLAWDGTNFFLATYSPNYLRKLTLGDPPDVTVDWIVTLPGWPMDLAYGDAHLYYPEYLGPIRRIDPSNGDVVGTIPSPSDYIYAMTFDGANLIAAYGVGGGDRVFWVVAPSDGSVLDTWTVPGWTVGVWGLAFDLAAETLYIGCGDGIVVAEANPASVTEGTAALPGPLLRCGPNPIGRMETLTVHLSAAGPGALDLFDLSGRRIAGLSHPEGARSFTVPVSELLGGERVAAGVYLLCRRPSGTGETGAVRLILLDR